MIESRFSIAPYIMLTKPGIVLGNVLAAIGGYFVARAAFELSTFLAMALGTALVIAGSCVINNYFDRDIDVYMKRTARRPSVTGAIATRTGLLYASVLLVGGFTLLFWFTPLATALLGLFGAVSYTAIYGITKRKTYWGTFIGAFPGAVPPMAGYAAAAGVIDATALILFAMMFVWQMVHFYAIALFRMKDYATAKVPVLPVAKGIRRTFIEMRMYAVLFFVFTVMLVVHGDAGYMFLLALVPLAAYWLMPLHETIRSSDVVTVARTIFARSLLVLFAMSVLWMFTSILPY